jgi:hypothetical protein
MRDDYACTCVYRGEQNFMFIKELWPNCYFIPAHELTEYIPTKAAFQEDDLLIWTFEPSAAERRKGSELCPNAEHLVLLRGVGEAA